MMRLLPWSEFCTASSPNNLVSLVWPSRTAAASSEPILGIAKVYANMGSTESGRSLGLVAYLQSAGFRKDELV